ncbi:hypothetical protein V1506DRAFT_165594, partial [Lipomyces tetrasporus]
GTLDLLLPRNAPTIITFDRPSSLCCALVLSVIMSAASSPEPVPISVDDLSDDSELSELSSPDSSVSSSTASSTPPPDPDHFETRLWRHFPGWVWSERSK